MGKKITIKRKDYKKCLNFIRKDWKKLTFYVPKNEGLILGLPNPFIAPNRIEFRKSQYYWDSYFIILGLLESKKIKLAKGMVDNLVYLYMKYDMIPASNRIFSLGLSQQPFLSSMAMEVFEKDHDEEWLKKVMIVVERELNDFWMGEKHLSIKNLSRYCDQFETHHWSEFETGWDITSRFSNRCLDYLPVDLNCCLYKYEKDLSKFYALIGNRKKEREYSMRSELRKNKIIKLMWNGEKGFFFDYNYRLGKMSEFYSLAGFYPMWLNMIDKEKVEKMRENIKIFEYDGGLATTQKNNLYKIKRQWDYPNGWANLEWIVVQGLLNYGYKEDAKRIAKKWLDLNMKLFKKTGELWEKYDVVNMKIGKSGLYKTQSGFGWTNAIFLKLVNLLGE